MLYGHSCFRFTFWACKRSWSSGTLAAEWRCFRKKSSKTTSTHNAAWAVAPDKFHFYSDVNRATQRQVLKLRSHPWIPSKVVIRGFVFDLSTGELREVTAKDESLTRPGKAPLAAKLA